MKITQAMVIESKDQVYNYSRSLSECFIDNDAVSGELTTIDDSAFIEGRWRVMEVVRFPEHDGGGYQYKLVKVPQ